MAVEVVRKKYLQCKPSSSYKSTKSTTGKSGRRHKLTGAANAAAQAATAKGLKRMILGANGKARWELL